MRLFYENLTQRSKITIKAIQPFLSAHKKVLDIGCGNGVVSNEIKKYFNCSITGTDVIDYLKVNIDFKKMSREDKLDFNDKEFDIGLFSVVLHHIPFDIQIRLIKEALRVCSEVLIFEEEPTFTAKLIDYATNKINSPKVRILLTHRDKEGWIELFKQNNINFEYHPVKKPIFFYLITRYLFYLKAL